MPLDETVLLQAREARDRLIRFEHEAELARVSYQHAIRRLHASGGSLREIADSLGLSYQRVHQIVDVASGKGAVKPAPYQRMSCSFCGRSREEAGRCVAGPDVRICNDCVDLAQEALDTGTAATGGLTRLVSLDLSDPKARCSFCGKRRDQAAGMAETPDRLAASKYSRRRTPPRICGECLTLCGEIIAEEGGG
ncbi:MAG TPA: ClpX C4-type zinc finger protein [Actinomycetota bacterium]|nr:ClpX C4-type zinc finger protein [Actinomycetota bacterium]